MRRHPLEAQNLEKVRGAAGHHGTQPQEGASGCSCKCPGAARELRQGGSPNHSQGAQGSRETAPRTPEPGCTTSPVGPSPTVTTQQNGDTEAKGRKGKDKIGEQKQCQETSEIMLPYDLTPHANNSRESSWREKNLLQNIQQKPGDIKMSSRQASRSSLTKLL